MPIGGSPRFFAAYHVLHRLLAPRHPPDALITLDRFEFHRTQGQTPYPQQNSVRYQVLPQSRLHNVLEPGIRSQGSGIRNPRTRLQGPYNSFSSIRLTASISQRPHHPQDGGADRDRTGDLKLAKLALSQLSYGPDVPIFCPLIPDICLLISDSGGPGKT